MDHHSTTAKYIRSKTHSDAHQTVFTKESDKYQWLVLGQKSQCEVEVRQTDFQIPCIADEINLIYQFGEQSKAETCASLSAILPQMKDSGTGQMTDDDCQ